MKILKNPTVLIKILMKKLSDKSESYIIDNLDNLIKKVFLEWSVSDVETGIFLSSGLDSNLVNILSHQKIDVEKFLINFSNSKDNENEYEILTAFLPKQLGEEETKKILC